MPAFDPERDGVVRLGQLEQVLLLDIAARAQEVADSYASYGLVGCNCQHFTMELAGKLGFRTDMPEDAHAVTAVEVGVGAVGTVVVGASATMAAGAAVGV